MTKQQRLSRRMPIMVCWLFFPLLLASVVMELQSWSLHRPSTVATAGDDDNDYDYEAAAFKWNENRQTMAVNEFQVWQGTARDDDNESIIPITDVGTEMDATARLGSTVMDVKDRKGTVQKKKKKKNMMKQKSMTTPTKTTTNPFWDDMFVRDMNVYEEPVVVSDERKRTAIRTTKEKDPVRNEEQNEEVESDVTDSGSSGAEITSSTESTRAAKAKEPAVPMQVHEQIETSNDWKGRPENPSPNGEQQSMQRQRQHQTHDQSDDDNDDEPAPDAPRDHKRPVVMSSSRRPTESRRKTETGRERLHRNIHMLLDCMMQ